jgi:hypothetical protein
MTEKKRQYIDQESPIHLRESLTTKYAVNTQQKADCLIDTQGLSKTIQKFWQQSTRIVGKILI